MPEAQMNAEKVHPNSGYFITHYRAHSHRAAVGEIRLVRPENESVVFLSKLQKPNGESVAVRAHA